MKHSNLWNCAGLVAMALIAGGCASKMAAPQAVEESAISSQPAQPQLDTARTAGAVTPAAVASEKAPGFVVHIDPITGEFLPGPPAGAVTPPKAAETAKVPPPQFFEVPSPVPGGGVMIDLQGHFRTPLVATIDADGKVTLKHETTMPADAVKK